MDPHARGIDTLLSGAPDNLIGGEFPLATKVVVLLTGAAHLRGELLGQVTASGKYVKSLSASSDGSQNASAVLAHDVDATNGDVEAVVYLTGEFRKEGLILGTGHTLSSVNAALRDLSIFIV